MLALTGVEATALDTSGRISIGEERAHRLDWVLCDLSQSCSEGTLRNTPPDKRKYADNVIRAYMNLCDVPYVNAIAHPFNTGNTTPVALPSDYPEPALRELAAKMRETGKVFDVMNLMPFWFQHSGVSPRELNAQYAELVGLFAAEGVIFQVSSDDHRCGLGHIAWSLMVLREADVTPAQVVDPKTISPRR